MAGDFFRTTSLFGGYSLTPGGLVDFQGFSEGPKRPLQAFGKSSKSAREGPSLSRTCMVSGILRPLASALKSFCGCQKWLQPCSTSVKWVFFFVQLADLQVCQWILAQDSTPGKGHLCSCIGLRLWVALSVTFTGYEPKQLPLGQKEAVRSVRVGGADGDGNGRLRQTLQGLARPIRWGTNRRGRPFCLHRQGDGGARQGSVRSLGSTDGFGAGTEWWCGITTRYGC